MIARPLVIAGLLIALAACAQSNTAAELTAPAPQPATVQAPPPGQTAAPAPAQATAAPPPPKATLTPEEAKAQCWMKYENDRRAKSIDARLILVEKCVDDTLRGQLVQAPPRR